MADDYFNLRPEDRLDALTFARTRSGRSIHLLEKDVWVVWALRELFASSYGEHLIFKGGTSLSKVYHVIDRFSEDIDITYDIRAIAGDLVAQGEHGLPKSRSQQKKWTDTIRKRLRDWTAAEMLPFIQRSLSKTDSYAVAMADGDSIFISYRPVLGGTGYVAPVVKIEFGARSTGEPHESRHVTTDAAAYLKELVFPEADVRVMRAERTFWEKATAIHVFCLQAETGSERFARHWYDLVQLDRAGVVSAALKDRALANRVADHKSIFFAEKGSDGGRIDYHAATNGSLKLVPEGRARTLIEADYAQMLEDGLLPEAPESFGEIMESCAEIQKRANDF